MLQRISAPGTIDEQNNDLFFEVDLKLEFHLIRSRLLSSSCLWSTKIIIQIASTLWNVCSAQA